MGHTTRKFPWQVIAALALAVALGIGIWAAYYFDNRWTGLPGTTLWDWLSLLFLPAAVLTAAWFLNQQAARRGAASARQHFQEETLRDYTDVMSNLLLNHSLGEMLTHPPQDPSEKPAVVHLAQLRTVTVLRLLNRAHRAEALRFLRDAGLLEGPHGLLRGALLHDIDLSGADLQAADLRGASLLRARLTAAHLRSALLGQADLRQCDLSGADLTESDLSGAQLGSALLAGANLSWTRLEAAQLPETQLPRAILFKANLHGANLTGVDLSRADVRTADLSQTTLIRANLSGADLYKAHLTGADLRMADLRSADLRESVLVGANLSEALFDEKTKLREGRYWTPATNMTHITTSAEGLWQEKEV